MDIAKRNPSSSSTGREARTGARASRGEGDRPASRGGRLWFAVALFVGLVCPLFFSTWYTFDSQQASLRRAFALELERMATVLAQGMREPIWHLTPALGQPVVESLMSDPRVKSVEVTSDGLGTFLRAAKVVDDEAEPVRVSRPVLRGEEEIGRVTLELVPIYLDDTLSGQWPKFYLLGAVQVLLGLGVVLFAYRILRRQEREEALREMNFVLAQQVDARAQELEAAQAELLRRESLAVLGRLTATVSHELRNPLGTIRTSIATLNASLEDDAPVVERALERADRNVDRCVRIIDELLGFARTGELSLEDTDLDDWLRQVLDDLDLPGTVELTLELGAGVSAPVDRERLRQVVVNVVGNACQAMMHDPGAEPQGTLRVATRLDGDRLEIAFTDSGSGVSPEILEKIFEPLFSTKTFGFGLGLPLVRRVMEHHGGGAAMASGDGGATMTLWLDPAALRAQAAAAPPE